jgi:hypothetical protein
MGYGRAGDKQKETQEDSKDNSVVHRFGGKTIHQILVSRQKPEVIPRSPAGDLWAVDEFATPFSG